MYEIIDINPPGTQFSTAPAVNVHGAVLINTETPRETPMGTPRGPDYEPGVFVYKAGKHTVTGLVAGYDINRYGQVIGDGSAYEDDAQNTSWTYLYDNDQISELKIPNAFVFAMNDPGRVVGAIIVDQPQDFQPFLYENATQITTLGVPGGLATAVDINASGHTIILQTIVDPHINLDQGIKGGWQLDGPDTQTSGYLYRNGKLTQLETLGGEFVNPMGINDSDVIVGGSNLPDGDFHAFLWDRGQLTDLGTLAGCRHSIATAINAADTVVGYSFGSGNGWRPFLWNLEQGMQDLNDLVLGSDWLLDIATDINNSGQIVGAGWHTLHGPKNVRVTLYHAFLLTPDQPEVPLASEEAAGAAYFSQVLAGLFADSAGWYIGPDGQPHYQGPSGPGDPGGPVFQRMSASARDALLGLAISQVAPLIQRGEPRETIRRAALELLNQAAQQTGSAPAQPVSGPRPKLPHPMQRLSKFGKLRSRPPRT